MVADEDRPSTPSATPGEATIQVARTPDAHFDGLPDFPHAASYVEVDAGDGSGPLRMAYVDAGPADGPVVLLLHGQPTWSFLYRHVVDTVVAGGARAIAVDNIGFGRSDKPVSPYDYTLARHVAWTRSLVERLDLREVTLVCQDWGGPVGLSALAADPDRYAGIVAANTVLHTGDPALAGRLTWALHGDADASRITIEESLVDYLLYTQRAPRLRASDFVAGGTATPPSPEVLRAYDAPFGDPTLEAGLRQMTALLPLTRNDPGARLGRATTRFLSTWERPFLTCYSDGDPATRGWEAVFQDLVPGAHGLSHRIIEGAGHFLQEEAGVDLALAVLGLLP